MKTAILLSSMGGPDSLEAVKPFLFNLFYDPAIIRLPSLPRRMLAWIISRRRSGAAREIYKQMGGKSTILENTVCQSRALQGLLGEYNHFRCFVGMSYWHPFIDETIKEIKEYAPDRLIVLPMYPQYSTTTTEAVIRDVKKSCRQHRLNIQTIFVESFYGDDGFVRAVAEQAKDKMREAEKYGNYHILFSAHGLPQKIVDQGDPYVEQCEATASLVAEQMRLERSQWTLCYQSRVGPLLWTEPSTESVIQEMASKGMALVVVPIAFVCEHSETLVELGIEYRNLASKGGSPYYGLAETVGVKGSFIQGLAEKIQKINQN